MTIEELAREAAEQFATQSRTTIYDLSTKQTSYWSLDTGQIALLASIVAHYMALVSRPDEEAES